MKADGKRMEQDAAAVRPLHAFQTLFEPEGVLMLVAAEYDVGTALDCRLWLSGVTDTYLVTTDRGRYAARLYRAGRRTDDEIAYELDAIQHLVRKGVSVAVPLARTDGSRVRVVDAPEGPRPLVVFAYAAGQDTFYPEDAARRYGRGLAELHAASDGFRSAHTRVSLDVATLIDRPLARIGPLLAERQDAWRELVGIAARARERIEALPSSALDWGFCHGDTFGANAHLDGDTLTFFDVDDCGPGWRAYDLASFRWSVAWRFPGVDARWQACLDGYRGRRAFREADLAVVPLCVPVRELWVIGQQVRAAATRGHWLVSGDYFDRRLAFLREWERRHLA